MIQKRLPRLLLLCLLFLLLLIGCNTPEQKKEEVGPVWETITRSDSPLLDNKINDLSLDTEGKMWIATDSGANAYHSSSWYTYKDSLSYNNTSSGTGTNSVGRVVNSIASSSSGVIWFALKGGGLVRFNRYASTTAWKRYTQTTGISTNYVNTVGILYAYDQAWVGSISGVNQYIPSATIPEQGTWQTWDISTYLNTSYVKVIKVNASNNTVWFGTDKGLLSYDYNNWQQFTIATQYNATINAIALDANNTLWVGRPDGASKLNIRTSVWTHYNHDENTNNVMPRSVSVNAVATDMENKRWFGTSKGLLLLQDTTWTIFTHSSIEELPSDTIRALAYDRKGNLWIGTYKGIVVYNPNGTRLK